MILHKPNAMLRPEVQQIRESLYHGSRYQTNHHADPVVYVACIHSMRGGAGEDNRQAAPGEYGEGRTQDRRVVIIVPQTISSSRQRDLARLAALPLSAGPGYGKRYCRKRLSALASPPPWALLLEPLLTLQIHAPISHV